MPRSEMWRTDRFLVTVEVGLSGDCHRTVVLRAHEYGYVEDLAAGIQWHFKPEYDQMSIELVAGNTYLEWGTTLKDAGIKHGDVIRAVIVEQWEVELHQKTVDHYPCACGSPGCLCVGPNFRINTKLLNPMHRLHGNVTDLHAFLKSCNVMDDVWSKHNHGCMDAAELRSLVARCAGEQVWCCQICRKLAFCQTYTCRPHVRWYTSRSGKKYCIDCEAHLCFTTAVRDDRLTYAVRDDRLTFVIPS